MDCLRKRKRAGAGDACSLHDVLWWRVNEDGALVDLEVLGKGPCNPTDEAGADSARSFPSNLTSSSRHRPAKRAASRYCDDMEGLFYNVKYGYALPIPFCASLVYATDANPATLKASCVATAMPCSPARTTAT